jgi:glycerophosphoryl diester phosphodiesterase
MNFWEHFPHDRLIAAHRGFRAIRAENTMAAFEASVGKCDFVELDVGFSRDGVPIIIHDDTLERTSDAAELEGFMPPYAVVDYSYAELLRLDFSSWFMQKDPFGTIASGVVTRVELETLPAQHILTLEEVLSFFKQHQIPVNVEIKDMRATDFDAVATRKVLDLLKETEMEESVLLSSFNHTYIAEAKALAPHISRAALQEHAHPEDLLVYLRELGVECYHCDLKIVTEEVVRELTDAGITVNVYTVNTPEEKERMFSWGVKSVFTDFL